MIVEYIFYSESHYIESVVYRNKSLDYKIEIQDAYSWFTGSKNYLMKGPYNMQVAIL